VAFAAGAIPEVAGLGSVGSPGDVRGLADAVISTLENRKRHKDGSKKVERM